MQSLILNYNNVTIIGLLQFTIIIILKMKNCYKILFLLTNKELKKSINTNVISQNAKNNKNKIDKLGCHIQTSDNFAILSQSYKFSKKITIKI